MSKEKVDKPSVALFLEKGARAKVFIACVLLMFYITSSQAGLIILQTPMLTAMNMMEQFVIVAVAGTLGLSIMTPIGGKIGDIIGRKNTILIFGIIAFIGTSLVAVFQSVFAAYIGLRFVVALAQGALISVPYIVVGQIFPKEEAPKKMGVLASAIAIGSFTGSWLPGIFADMNLTFVAIVYPLMFLLIALLLVAGNLPNVIPENKAKIDLIGVFLLIIVLVSLVLSLNYGAVIGWTNVKIIAGLITFVISLIAFIKFESGLEKNNKSPLITISLFKNLEYSILLIVGFSSIYYQTMMLNYGAYASINILGSSIGEAGRLALPRTVITMILPVFTGVWVAKNLKNSWKAIAISTGLVAVALLPIAKIDNKMSIIVLYVVFAITGIAESFRGVSITPAAQRLLQPEFLATGTALLNFINTLASVFAAAISGSLLGYAKENQVLGIRLIFISAIIVAVVGFLLTVLYIRPKQMKRIKEQE